MVGGNNSILRWAAGAPTTEALEAEIGRLDERVGALQSELANTLAERRLARSLKAALYGGLHTGSLSERIMDLLNASDGAVRARDLRQMLADTGEAVTANRVQTQLSRLVEMGRLARDRPGYYRVIREDQS